MRRFTLILLVLASVWGILWFFVIKPKQATEDSAPVAGVFQNLFSRNDSIDVSNNGEEDGSVFSNSPTLGNSSSFTRITSTPVAGYTVFKRTKTITVPAVIPGKKPTTETITEHFVRYVSRTNGYVYEIKDGGTTTQISNIYIPNVYEASFNTDGRVAFLRFLRPNGRTIATYTVPVPEANPDNSRTQQNGVYLQEGISSLAISPDGKSVVQLGHDLNNSILSSLDLKSGTKKELLRSPLHGWLVSWPNQSIYLQTKATAFAPGFLYRVDTTNKRLVRILGDINGLTTSVSPKGSFILYSESTSDGLSSKIFNTKTSVVRSIAPAILPEKCVWLESESLLCAGNSFIPASSYPDSWYAGLINFSDKLYRIYTNINTYDTIDQGQEWSYDATNLQVDELNRLLYFIDKSTGLLWQFAY